jgi:hypothetical protein
MAETTVKTEGKTTVSPQTTENPPEVPEVPWTDEDVETLTVALQRVGPFYLGNDVRSVESAKAVALEILRINDEMGYEVLEAKPEGTLAPPEGHVTPEPLVTSGTAGNPR